MAERRVSGWFVMSAVFIVAVFGLFFTFTERKTWPEQRVELSAADMRLVPPSSTLWCEAVALYSDHPFVAYQVSHAPLINPKHLNRQRVSLNMKLNGGKFGNTIKLKYYLLPSSVVEVLACATYPGARVLVFKGEEDVSSYMEEMLNKENAAESGESASAEASSEEHFAEYLELLGASTTSNTSKNWKTKPGSVLISDSAVLAIGHQLHSPFDCVTLGLGRPIHLNITQADFYVIAITNADRRRVNMVNLQISLDRSRYAVLKTGQTFDMCSLSTSCTIGLSFASKERALVWIPEEPNAGRTTFVVRSQCKPRLAVFAFLSVFFPLIIFLGVAFVVRADRERIMRFYQCRSRPEREQTLPDRPFVAPLLDGVVTRSDSASDSSRTVDDSPPPYHTLFDAPPPYACIKKEVGK